LKRKI